MNKISIILVAVSGLFFCGHTIARTDDPTLHSNLDFLTAFQVVWMHDQERLAMDLNQAFHQQWGDSTFASIAASKPGYMEKLMYLIDWYDISMFGPISNEPRVYTDERHADAFDELFNSGMHSLQSAFLAAAYVEEWNIMEYRADIMAIELSECDPCQGLQLLTEAYGELLAVSYVNLAILASEVNHYQAQMLSQADVDDILAETTVPPQVAFEINGGLTDAWYNPAISGQGFFITVYENQNSVFLAWLTYDTNLPEPDVTADIGDAGQRWLVAQGSYDGDMAELVVYSASGGLFDASPPVPSMESIGEILLQFEDCDRGTVTYDLAGIGTSGIIPIRRLVPDNSAVCKIKTPLEP